MHVEGKRMFCSLILANSINSGLCDFSVTKQEGKKTNFKLMSNA